MRAGILLVVLAWAGIATAQPALMVSRDADRSGGVALDGQVFDQATQIHVFVEARPGIRRVRFYLDDPDMAGAPHTVERLAPWDLAGGTPRAAKPFLLSRLAPGIHTITAAIERGPGAAEVVSASFSVGVIASVPARAPVALEFPASPDHAAVERGVELLDRYELRCYQPGAREPFHAADLGKPTPDATGAIRVDLTSAPVALPVGVLYAIRIASIGPHGVSLSEASATVGHVLALPRLSPQPWSQDLR